MINYSIHIITFPNIFYIFADILRRRREIERKSEKKNVFT